MEDSRPRPSGVSFRKNAAFIYCILIAFSLPTTNIMAFRVFKKTTAFVVLAVAALASASNTPSNPQNVTSFTRDTLTLSFAQAHRLWSSEVATGQAPDGTRAFRKVIVSPAGKTPLLADIIMNGDDDFTLYVNGELLGGPYGWDVKRFCVPLLPCTNVFAATVLTTLPQPVVGAGLLATIQITYADNSTSTVVTDPSWRVAMSPTAGFERSEFDDSGWSTAYSYGQYPGAPWGAFTEPGQLYYRPIPATVDCKNVNSNPSACTNTCERCAVVNGRLI
ncbi:hypothetical protein FB451DRAFT_1289669 [Mycena latifolia]|nr:hypothetical protein FB451DRAFT_1289669 [Mycena latifolia]